MATDTSPGAASYEEVKERCLSSGSLFVDEDFPVHDRSIFYNRDVPSYVKWCRPHEISTDPKLFIDGATRFDLHQGKLGNCWFIAAATTIAGHQDLLNNVVPTDQGFGDEYAGIFRFYFWRFGDWEEVIIDDRIPTAGDRPLFCHNPQQSNEFWSSLLEKAYAKLHGSYQALEGGKIQDALVDMTGGIGEVVGMHNKEEIPKGLFKSILQTHRMNSLMGCSIPARSREEIGQRQENGLYSGHAYSITSVVQVKTPQGRYKLVRLRNPYGRGEWNGAWSDGSSEWEEVKDLKEKLNLTVEDEGEFWMSYYDWKANFSELQICHLSPDTMIHKGRHSWRFACHHGSWVRDVSAGGSGKAPYEELYWCNPQFEVSMQECDHGDEEHQCTMVVSLMQKYRRRMRTEYSASNTNLSIGFDIYKVTDGVRERLNRTALGSKAELLSRNLSVYNRYRELTQRYCFSPGTYVLIPCSVQIPRKADFYIRIVTEMDVQSLELSDDVLDETDTENQVDSPEEEPEWLTKLFRDYAGGDDVIDVKELCRLLNKSFRKDLGSERFSRNSTRALFAVLDTDESGVLECAEVRAIWKRIQLWRLAFRKADKDDSGSMNVKELRKIFLSLGIRAGRKILEKIVLKYGGKDGYISFQEFILIAAKLLFASEKFSKAQDSTGSVKMTYDELASVML